MEAAAWVWSHGLIYGSDVSKTTTLHKRDAFIFGIFFSFHCVVMRLRCSNGIPSLLERCSFPSFFSHRRSICQWKSRCNIVIKRAVLLGGDICKRNCGSFFGTHINYVKKIYQKASYKLASWISTFNVIHHSRNTTTNTSGI